MAKGFPLAIPGEVRIVLKLRKDGELEELVHCFREPNAADRKEYYRRRNRAELENKDGAADYLDINEWLWGYCIKSVEGYDFKGQETGVRNQESGAKSKKAKKEQWKELIPLEHKLWAVEGLMGRIGVLQGIESKN